MGPANYTFPSFLLSNCCKLLVLCGPHLNASVYVKGKFCKVKSNCKVKFVANNNRNCCKGPLVNLK